MIAVKSSLLNYSNPDNVTQLNKSEVSSTYDLNSQDSAWILLCGYTIFTMQIGFALFEAGVISKKNRVNIMTKNVVDLVLGGLTYW